jgi:allantoate deiminase
MYRRPHVSDAPAARILRELDDLAGCTSVPGAITRLFLTPAHARAVSLVRTWMERAGLATRLDASGTLVGRDPAAAADTARLLLGSHIDTVRDAGRYDGCLGVALAVELAARARLLSLPYTIEVRAFGDEEGVRFPVTLTGALAAAGQVFDPTRLQARDEDGITMADALRDFGLDADALVAGDCTATGAFAYLEIHIEQGPVLEAAGAPLGVVTAINGAARLDVAVTGQAGHAGTVPMSQRHDALAAAAEMVLAVRRIARAGRDLVATVGRLNIAPNAANVIPASCHFSVDVRAPCDTKRDEAVAAICEAIKTVAADDGVAARVVRSHVAPAVKCDTRLQNVLAEALSQAGLQAPHLPSGAGHDAMALASLCPVGMLFVRCTGGISHHPTEHVTEADVAAALEVMTIALTKLDPQMFKTGNAMS